MKCPKCGAEIPQGSNFCESCGTAVGTMTFTTAVKTCFVKYVDSKGRASRAEFWWFQLLSIVASTIFSKTLFVPLVFLCPEISSAIRRYHDTNRSGWWILCPIMNIVYLCYPSDPYTNQYGEVPA